MSSSGKLICEARYGTCLSNQTVLCVSSYLQSRVCQTKPSCVSVRIYRHVSVKPNRLVCQFVFTDTCLSNQTVLCVNSYLQTRVCQTKPSCVSVRIYRHVSVKPNRLVCQFVFTDKRAHAALKSPAILCDGTIVNSMRQHTGVSIRQHSSAFVSIRQHTSAYVSIVTCLSTDCK